MPHVLKTVIPRIRRSLRERGLGVSLGRSVLLPLHLFQEYCKARRSPRIQVRSDFDLENDVHTDGDINGWTHLSDLEIPSANWIYGRNYAPIEPARFEAIVSGVNVRFEDFVFVDFGSGKGRALLLASEFPFKRVVGVEFSPELHQVAQQNIQKYASRRRCGAVESVCMDFLNFALSKEPLILFFFDPCEDAVLVKLLRNVRQSLEANRRTAYVIYVAPTNSKKALFEQAEWLMKVQERDDLNTCIYRTL
jgi:SAM-dependent methyltransferase